METITTKAPSKGIIDSHLLTTGKTMAFFNGKIDKESIFIKGVNYNYDDVVISADPFLAQIVIKTKLKLKDGYFRELNPRLNTINIKQEDIEKDCFASSGIDVVAEKMVFKEPQDVEIKLKSKLRGKYQNDESVLTFAGKVCNNLTIGVGLSVNTNGTIVVKKNKLIISNATNVEVFIKMITGYNPLSKMVELDVSKVLDKTRKQMSLLESELYDIVKMKHLMDIDKKTLGD